MSEKNIKILIADDDENQRILYSQELQDEGYTILCAVDGKDAIDKVLTEKPDLVILDIQMPGINGIETLDEILDFNKQMPIILHSAYSNYKDNFMSWAADAYIVKSSDLSELVNKVKEILTKRGIIKC